MLITSADTLHNDTTHYCMRYLSLHIHTHSYRLLVLLLLVLLLLVLVAQQQHMALSLAQTLLLAEGSRRLW
jgi:hypothetical protein